MVPGLRIHWVMLGLALAFQGVVGCGNDASYVAPQLEQNGDGDTAASAQDSSSVTQAPPAFELSWDSTSCIGFVEGNPVGISCLQCGHPNAREQALKIANIMAQSCRRHLATIMLVDGTYSDNRDVLSEVVQVATKRGSTLHLFLYLSNGPWQRHHINPNKGIGTGLEPEQFRQNIQYDPVLQTQYQNRVRWALPLIVYAQSLGAVVYLIPMLEDNLDYASARKMEELTLAVVPPSVSVALGRNPCPNCYAGNDSSVPAGVFLDQHIVSSYDVVRVINGLVSNDGLTFAFPNEIGALTDAIPFDGLLSFIGQAAAANDAFVIWRMEYQGKLPGGEILDPDNRNFVIPSDAEAQVLIQVLQMATAQ
jgi:hypothetical protein